MIAFPSERKRDELDLEHSKQDIALVRSLARRGLLSGDQLAAMSARLEQVAIHGEEERMRVAADKALAVMQVSLMKLLADSATQKETGQSVTNQQINFYLPANGRDQNAIEQANGNGRH